MVGVDEACALLGVGKSKFYELIRTGELEAVDINNVAGQYARPGERGGRRRALRVEEAEISRFKRQRTVRA
jgi:predicted DNA-binding transcriptional regulator AlpA